MIIVEISVFIKVNNAAFPVLYEVPKWFLNDIMVIHASYIMIIMYDYNLSQ